MPDSGARAPIARLVGIYRADGGLVGEFRYLAGHYLRGEECSLCSVTHSTFRRRREWDAEAASLAVPFDLRHRNELDASLAHYAGQSACIVAIGADGSSRILLTDSEISQAHGDVETLFTMIRNRMRASKTASLPACDA